MDGWGNGNGKGNGNGYGYGMDGAGRTKGMGWDLVVTEDTRRRFVRITMSDDKEHGARATGHVELTGTTWRRRFLRCCIMVVKW